MWSKSSLRRNVNCCIKKLQEGRKFKASIANTNKHGGLFRMRVRNCLPGHKLKEWCCTSRNNCSYEHIACRSAIEWDKYLSKAAWLKNWWNNEHITRCIDWVRKSFIILQQQSDIRMALKLFSNALKFSLHDKIELLQNVNYWNDVI